MYKCPTCNEDVWGGKRSLDGHMANKHNQLQYKCGTCSKQFASSRGMKGHDCASNKVTKCDSPGCSYTGTEDYMKEHKRRVHSGGYTCILCHGHFNDTQNKVKHEDICMKRKTAGYVCPICQKRFTSKRDLNGHTKYCIKKQTECSSSSTQTEWANAKAAHPTIPSAADVRKKIEEGKKKERERGLASFRSGMSVQETEKFEEVYIKEEMTDAQQVNTSTSTWSSSVCFCKCEENNENNNLKAEGLPANQFKAGSEHFNQVGEDVKIEDDRVSRGVLANAELLDCKGLQSDECNLPLSLSKVRRVKIECSSVPNESDCGSQGETAPSGTGHKLKKHKQTSTLANHERTNTGEKMFFCSFCDYKSSRSSHLAIHKRKHTVEKPYSCSLCDYKTSQLGYLTIHKLTHTVEKPYSCSLCDYKTSQSSALTVHKQTHTGEKPYSCRLCDYKASRAVTLIIHERIKHKGEKPQHGTGP
ncbi:zinc finger protein 271-like [Bolinopsis microptera]|uniref:zinc finger protein 271-like n=1 Tax=Bolinopsis microptera TaxID=2820187 RepID=UPI00307A02D3